MAMSGINPHLTSSTDSFESAVAKRTSPASAICSPPPRQWPWIARSPAPAPRASDTRCAGTNSGPARATGPSGLRPGLVGHHAGDVEAGAEARTFAAQTTARTPGSAATRSAAAVIASNMATSSALCFSGRVRVTTATWSAISIRDAVLDDHVPVGADLGHPGNTNREPTAASPRRRPEPPPAAPPVPRPRRAVARSRRPIRGSPEGCPAWGGRPRRCPGRGS